MPLCLPLPLEDDHMNQGRHRHDRVDSSIRSMLSVSQSACFLSSCTYQKSTTEWNLRQNSESFLQHPHHCVHGLPHIHRVHQWIPARLPPPRLSFTLQHKRYAASSNPLIKECAPTASLVRKVRRRIRTMSAFSSLNMEGGA